MTDSGPHDDLLFSMLKECKTLPIFLDHVFGFLNRRTDFYHVATEPRSPVGLLPGVAEQTVKQIFYKWKPGEKTLVPAAPIAPKPPVKPRSDKFTPSDSYNGAVFDTYSWSQSLLEVDVAVKLPDGATKKDLSVETAPERISVRLKDGTVLVEGELCERCKHDVIWSVQKNKLELHLDKCKELWWNCFVKTEPKLDVTTLDCSRPYEELPEEAQSKIEELQWNQERKKLGLPTSDELALQKILEESWNAEGSPFSGPFDPSAVQFN